MSMIFYYGSGSQYGWKVWLTLEHKQIPYDFKLLSFDRGDLKKPEFLAVNPRGQVPAIVHDGFVLWESTAIVEYLEDRFLQRPLRPADPQARATMRRLMQEAEIHLYQAAMALLNETLFRDAGQAEDPAKIAAAQAALLTELAIWDSRLTADFLAGPLSLADFTVYPWLRTLRRIDERQPKNGLGNRLPPRLAAFMQRIEALPYYAKTTPPHWKS